MLSGADCVEFFHLGPNEGDDENSRVLVFILAGYLSANKRGSNICGLVSFLIFFFFCIGNALKIAFTYRVFGVQL